MKKLNFNNNIFYIKSDIIDEDVKIRLINDIEYEAKERPYIRDDIPPLQTYSDLLEKYKTPHWEIYKKHIFDFTSQCIDKKLKIVQTWANISIPNRMYDMHHHFTDLTTVLYLQNKYASYGTIIEDQFIIPGFEKSILLFEGKIEHSIVNMPYETAINNRRISLVCDFNYA